MATRVIDDGKLNDIAVVIQEKDNGGQMTVDEMPTRIEALPEIVDEEAALVLIDWEGTLLRSYTRDEVMVLTSLPNPSTLPNYAYADHEWLVFQEWNWSLAGIKNFCSKYGYCPLYVGAIYDTTDHLNHFDYENGIAKFGMQGDNYFVGFEWGLNSFSLCHGYNQNRLETTTFINQHSLHYFNIPSDISGQKLKFSNCNSLKILSIPETATNLYSSYNFINCCNLRFLSLPETISINELFASNCPSLKCCNVPESVAVIKNDSLKINRSLSKIEIHNNVTSIESLAFMSNNRLSTIVIKGKPSLSNINAFQVDDKVASKVKATRIFYVPQANLSWFSTETNWADIYAQFSFVTIEDNIEYLESLGFNVDEYKEAT